MGNRIVSTRIQPHILGDRQRGTGLQRRSAAWRQPLHGVVALDADTGKLRWHYQFTPHDHYDYDSVQVPVLADMTWQGAPVKAILWANRNGNFYSTAPPENLYWASHL